MFTDILLGTISGLFLLLFSLSLGIVTLLCYVTIRRRRKSMNFAMQQNSIYDVHMNKSMKMSKNAAYETTIIEAKSEITIIEAKSETTIIEAKSETTTIENHTYETVNV